MHKLTDILLNPVSQLLLMLGAMIMIGVSIAAPNADQVQPNNIMPQAGGMAWATSSSTPTETPRPTVTAWLDGQPTAILTSTPWPTDTPTLWVPTSTPWPTDTATVIPTSTPWPTDVPTSTPTPVLAPATEASTDRPFVCIGGCAEPPPGSTCVIKGNVNSDGEKIYHSPGGMYYDRTDIKPEEGDLWFCTADEAVSSGFRPAER